MLISEKIQIFQRSEKSIGYTHIWCEAGEKYQRQIANLLLRADRTSRSPFRLVTEQTICAIISHII
ncbi:MAG: hypothetical protein EAZ90_02240 [Oscillatoriales cyanobacterium]|nr:MAG: hypothetical protein EAZ90_02240 [Oscillatoriales cyanobacterium]TAE55165.1 MAG: hypothetical protein EAZ88_07170 [Oscillatoriales cyanobacterium]TAG62912.1 MAG: hypothetical protein EAZ25_26080 [Oscillatoriales cyanobacterium]